MSDISRGNSSDVTSPPPSSITTQSSLVKYDPMGVISPYYATPMDMSRRQEHFATARHYQQLIEYQARLRRQLALQTGYQLMSGLPSRSQQAIMARYPGMTSALARNNMVGLTPDMKTLLSYFYSQKSPYAGLPLNQPHAAMNYHCQPEEPKPSHSYIGIIAMAILNSKDKKLVLSDIYQWILDNYPYFRRRGPGWRNSIRHNLSLNDCFIKSGRSANGKGHYWAVHPANIDDFKRGDFRRRRAQRKVRKAMGLAVPDDDDSPSPSPTPTNHHELFCNFQGKDWRGGQDQLGNQTEFADDSSKTGKEFSTSIDASDLDSSPSRGRKFFNLLGDFHHNHHHHSNHHQEHQPPKTPQAARKRLFDVESLLRPDPVELRFPQMSDHHHDNHHHHHDQQQQQRPYRNWYLDDSNLKITRNSHTHPLIDRAGQEEENTAPSSPERFQPDGLSTPEDGLTPDSGDTSMLEKRASDDGEMKGDGKDFNPPKEINPNHQNGKSNGDMKSAQRLMSPNDISNIDMANKCQTTAISKSAVAAAAAATAAAAAAPDVFNQHVMEAEVTLFRHFSSSGEPIKSQLQSSEKQGWAD